MSMRKPSAALLLLVAFGFAAAAAAPAPRPAGPTQAQPQAPDRLQWFREAKFGVFVHWGPQAA